jgi:hypothetical protein
MSLSAPTVYVCVTSRDGAIPRHTRVAVEAAVRTAEAAGIRCLSAEGGSPYGVALARNAVVAKFLASKCSHLLFVDDDVILPDDAVVRLAGVEGAGVALGCYVSHKVFGDGTRSFYVVVLRLSGGAEDVYRSWPVGVEEVAGGGAGCMMIARPVLEAIPYPWFRFQGTHVAPAGQILSMGEDVDFCQRVRALGLKVWADGAVRCGHWKEVDLLPFVEETA